MMLKKKLINELENPIRNLTDQTINKTKLEIELNKRNSYIKKLENNINNLQY